MEKLSTIRSASYADKREVPIYTYADAAYYLGIKVATLRSWVIGRSYRTSAGPRFFEPLIKAADARNGFLSFDNLAEAHILAATRYKHHVPLPNVRNAIVHLQKAYPSQRPLLSKEFYTDGLDLFIKNMTDTENISKQGQLGLKPVLDLFLHRIEFDEEFRPKKVWPLVKGLSESDKVISMVFGVSAGRPTVDGTGVPVAMIWQRHKAGEDIEDLADDYEIDVPRVMKAIEYIEHIKAA